MQWNTKYYTHTHGRRIIHAPLPVPYTIIRTDTGHDIRQDGKRIGYVDAGQLYGIGTDGYAVLIGPVEHEREYEPTLKAWLQMQNRLHAQRL